MIKSAYFPNAARCFAESTGDKIKVPADIFDAAVAQGTVANDLILLGDFTYETAKIFAQSGYVDVLEFNDTSGEIKTSSASSVSAEIKFAFAVWNGRIYDAVIERAILAQLGTNSLPEILSDKVSRINIGDGFKVETDFGKDIVGKSLNYVAADFQSDDTINVADFFGRRISFKQFVKNVTVTTAGTVSSSAFGTAGLFSAATTTKKFRQCSATNFPKC